MLFLDFGPEPIEYLGYGGKNLAPGDQIDGIATAQYFYDNTRRKWRPWLYSILCVSLPFLPFALALALALWLEAGWPPDFSPVPKGLSAIAGYQAEAKTALFKSFCDNPISKAPLADAVTGSLAHFSAMHIAFLSAALLSLYGAVRASWKVIVIHNAPVNGAGGAQADAAHQPARHRHEANRRKGHGAGAPPAPPVAPAAPSRAPVRLLAVFWSMAAPAFAAAVILWISFTYFSGLVHYAFRGLNILPQADEMAAYPCMGSFANGILPRLVFTVKMGLGLVIVTVSALMFAAATLSYRYETPDIKGAWSDTYILRHKLKGLLTLYFLASLLLVTSNLALSSFTDVSGAILTEAATAHDVDLKPVKKSEKATPGQASVGASDSQAAGADADAATAEKAASAILKETLAQVAALRKELSFTAGALGSLLLVAIFTPAFYGLMAEIEIAGKTQMARPNPTAPANSYKVAAYKDIQPWKEEHGLAVTTTQLTGSFVAILAPVLTGGLIDVGRAIIGG